MLPYKHFTASLILTFTLSFSGCKPESSSTCRLIADTLSISINESLLGEYFQYSFLQTDSSQLLAAFNHQQVAVDIFDLDRSGHIATVRLPQEGPNAIHAVTDIHLAGPDSLVVLTSYELLILDRSGHILLRNRINISDSPKEAAPRNYNIINFDSNQPLVAYQGFFLLGKYPFVERFEKNFLVAYSPVSSAHHDIHVYYPEYLKTAGKHYKHKWAPQYVRIEDKLYYSFPSASRIWTYSLTAHTIEEFPVSSLYNLPQARPITEFGRMNSVKYKYRELEYLRLHWLKKARKILRLHRLRKNNPDDDWEFYLMVLDENLDLVCETSIPNNNLLFYQAFAGSQGLYIPIRNDINDSEEQLRFLHLRIR